VPEVIGRRKANMGIGPLNSDGGWTSGVRHENRNEARSSAAPAESSRSLIRLAELADRVVRVQRDETPVDSRQDRIDLLRQKIASGFYDKEDVVKEIAKKLAGDR